MRPVMGRIPAVIFWLLTVAFPHNRAIRRPENQHHGEGPSGQNYVANDLPQDPSVWNQATPGATKWYQDQDCGGEGLPLDFPLWQKGRLVTKVPVTHTPLTHMSGNEPIPSYCTQCSLSLTESCMSDSPRNHGYTSLLLGRSYC